MGLTTGAAIYLVIWWLVLFMVLPWGVRTIGDDDVAKGHAPSAPQKPRMLTKMAVTTVVAAIVFAVVYVVAETGMVSLRE